MKQAEESSQSHRMVSQRWGHGEATWVLIHGWLVNGDVFTPLCRELALDARLEVVDLAGTGRSRPVEGSVGLADWTRDLVGLVQDCDQPVHLLGHSMGGLLAQLVAAEVPDCVASLTLVVPVPTIGFPLDGDIKALFESTPLDLAARHTVMDASCTDLQGELQQFMHGVADEVDAQAIEQGLRDWQVGVPNADLQRIACPTLVIGSGDGFLSDDLLEEQVVRKIPGASFVGIPAAGHYPLVQQPAATARIIEKFAATLRALRGVTF